MAKRKYFVQVKTGLIQDPRHREHMGNRVWLYMHMLDVCDWDTGLIYNWTDENAANDMSVGTYRISKWTVKQQRQELADAGYISCTQLKRSQIITIHNWLNPRSTERKVLNIKPVFGNDPEDDTPDMGVGDSASGNKGDGNPPPLEIKGEVNSNKGEVKGDDMHLRPTIKAHIDHTDPHTHGAVETWARVLEGLHQHYNGTFDAINPTLSSSDERPARLTVTVNHSDPSIANRIRTLAKAASGKTWQVKVIVNPPVVSGTALPIEQQKINALKVKYDQLTGGAQYFDGDDRDAFRFLVQRGVDAAWLESIYKHLKSQKWRTGRIAPRTLADNYLEVRHVNTDDRGGSEADSATLELAALVNASRTVQPIRAG